VRYLSWFSCGDASAVAAKLAVEKYGAECQVLYCDTFVYEHPDNRRFFHDVQEWIGVEIMVLRSTKYTDIYDVFDKTGWLVGVAGARCTTELKKIPRVEYQEPDDVHIFGYTADEGDRIAKFNAENPELYAEFPLMSAGLGKSDCHRFIREAGIEIPVMYKLGYRNNNCIGCVKGQQGYWNKIRVDFPDAFQRMAQQERKMNVAINKSYAGDGKRKRVFLDELDPDAGRFDPEPDIECGVICIHPDEEALRVEVVDE